MEIEAWVALIAATATTLSAGLIGWQAWETRRSAESSNKAAQASEAALVVANKSLELNRKQAVQSAKMVAEATRARLETNAPAVSIQFDRADAAVPESFMVGTHSSSGGFKKIEIGEQFQLPQDEGLWIYAVVKVMFHNDGLVPVTVLSQSTILPGSYEYASWVESFRIDVGRSAKMGLAVGTSLARWADMGGDMMRSRGESGWSTALSGDSGVRLSQTIRITGTVLEPGQKSGDFVLRRFGPDHNYPSYLVLDDPKRTYVIGGQEATELAPAEETEAEGSVDT